MLYNLTQPDTELAILHDIPTTFFERIEGSETFGNHLFPDWYEEVCGTLHGLKRKFEDFYNHYKAIENEELRRQLRHAFITNNRIQELCGITINDREIDKSNFSKTISDDLDAIFDQLYHSTLEYNKFEEKADTTVHEFIRSFIKINKQSFCPFCGIHSYSYIKGEARLALDHWLCKSNFPQASVNFDNLVPICEKCNKRPVKGERLVLDFPEGELERTKSLYPYLGHSGIRIAFSFNAVPNTSDFSTIPFSLVISAINNNDDEVVANWMSVFNIQSRFESFLRETIFEMWEVNLESYCQTNAFPQDFDINNFKEFLESHKLNYYHKNTPGHRLYQVFWNYIINVPDEPYIKSIYDNIKSKLNE